MFRSSRGSSRALILGIVRLRAPITRVELASETGLTAAAVSQLVAGLIQRRVYVEESQRRVPTRGQPPIELVIRSGAAYMLGLHLEHSLLTAVLVDLDGTVLGELNREHEAPEPREVLCTAASMCRELLKRSGSPENVLGVGLGSVGPLELDAGTVNAPPFFPDSWQRVPLRQRLADALGLPVFLDNNATAAATGEYWYGDGRRYPNFLFVHLGVGLGGGLFLDGRVYRGSTFNAGEVGHMIVGAARPEPPFRGTRGNLESYASLFALKYDLGDETHTNLKRSFSEQNPALLGWLERAARFFAQAVVSVDNLLDLDAVIFGGLLPGALNAHLVARVSEHRAAFQNLVGRPRSARCVAARTTRNGAALGAAMLPVYDAFVHAPSEAGVFKSLGGEP